eukprot:2550666-Rhodomonas_salina.1
MSRAESDGECGVGQVYGPLETGEAFEPFVLGARAVLPLYDERFRGYGWDKTTHANHVPALPSPFLCAPRGCRRC